MRCGNRFNFPGMRILQFAFAGAVGGTLFAALLSSANTVVYTGTHDNDTTRGWYVSATEGERAFCASIWVSPRMRAKLAGR